MSFISTLLAGFFSLPAPSLSGWALWFLFLALTVYNVYRWRTVGPAIKGNIWPLFLVLLVLVPLTNLFAGIRLPAGAALPMPGMPADPLPPALLPLSAIPWMIAAGPLGPLAAAALGALAGLLRGAWDTHSLFSIPDLAFLAALFSVSIRQRYRTGMYAWLRQPLIAAALLIPLHTIVYVIGTFVTFPGQAAVRLDYALSNAGVAALAFAGEVLVGGLVAQVLASAFPSAWGRNLPYQPSNTEQSLETRFLYGTGIFILLFLAAILVGDWIVAGRSARAQLQENMASSASTAAQSVPFFLESGHNQISQLAADPRLLTAGDAELSIILGAQMRANPYFDQIVVLDALSGNLLGGFPAESLTDFELFAVEQAALPLTVSGVPVQFYSIPPAHVEDGAARLSFLAGVVDSAGQVPRILIGRTNVATNALTQPVIHSLQSMSEKQGTGILLDELGNVLYHPNPSIVMSTPYEGLRGTEASFYTDTALDGTRQFVYYQPVQGRDWGVVLTLPAWRAQELALQIALPLSAVIIILALVALILLRVALRAVTSSLRQLASDANQITQGKLDHALVSEAQDEIGQLARAFEQMRASLKSRLDELNRLLEVSQGVASSLEMGDAVKPVLEAALSTGANAVRVVLSPAIMPKTSIELPSSFSLGPSADKFSHLDPQILQMAQGQERIVLSNLSRTRTLDLDANLPQPAALLAVPMRHENRYYGVMWAAYDKPRTFSEADVRFVSTLAGQAALATVNAHLFLSVEASRRQLEAILNSTPDPVLVIDPQGRLMLANPAAGKAVGMDVPQSMGEPIDKLIQQQPLLDLLKETQDERKSVEIAFPGGRTYLATASSVMAEGRPVGRVCVLRDVTHFKELDSMKSEFVATVSHDLRSPLTLMRGYATMLEMVGQINEQQQGYVRKIISGVENMSRLVNNLLDLGRIEIGVGLQVENVSVRDIVERVAGALQLQAAQKNITLSAEPASNLPAAIEADQALLHQGVYNLVENAIKYTPAGGRVTLSVRATSVHMLFEIRDNGIGIAPADMPRLFEKFYRGNQREARAQHGSGLGLAIVHSIAERHGGKVWVESELGKGSSFFLQVPLTQPQGAHS